LVYLNNLINNDKSLQDRTLIIGDININIIGNEHVNNEYLDMLSLNGFSSLINVYTRLPLNKTHSCLDHIFFKCSDDTLLNNTQSGVIQIDITDHCPIIASIPILKYEPQNSNKIKHINYSLINLYLEKETWECVYNEINIDIAVINFYDKLNSVIEKCTSEKKIVSKNKRIKEWMTAGLLCSTRKKMNFRLKSKDTH